ncbi:MAG: hypothetical protein IJ356_09150 [Erysipelotrichaceae bacterium]|nr:hypothetical protein [Erysipelotrichaceae bacterium]
MKNHNTLTYIKIIVCCLVFFFLPVFAELATNITESRTIALTLVISTSALFLISANHQLAGLHWRRFIANPKENIIYILFSALFIWASGYLSELLFSFQFEVIDPEILKKYLFFAPVIIITYTFSHAFSLNIIFKLLTDKINFHTEPHIVILYSGLLFALYMTCSQFVLPALFTQQVHVLTILKGFIMNFLVSLCCSYCYNQTRSIFPMTLGLTLASLFFLI